MLYKLTFKKAFGIRTIPSECMGWIFDFSHFQALTFTIGTTDFTFRTGRFGESKQEKIILSYGLPSHDRDLDSIHPTITLDISFYVDVTIDETCHDGGILNYYKFDVIIEPFIPLALEALNRAIDAHRIARYMVKRNSPEFRKGQVSLIREMTLTEFQIYLYYVLESDEDTLVGAYGAGGRMMISSCSDCDIIMSIMTGVVQTEIPLEKKLIVKSWEYLFAEDYRNSIIYAAMVLELAISKKLRKEFNSKSVASKRSIDKFIDNVSNRLLCTVILGLLKIGNEQLRTEIAKIFDIRNGLIHGKRKIIREEEAKDALYHTEELLKMIDNNNE